MRTLLVLRFAVMFTNKDNWGSGDLESRQRMDICAFTF